MRTGAKRLYSLGKGMAIVSMIALILFARTTWVLVVASTGMLVSVILVVSISKEKGIDEGAGWENEY